MTALNQGFFHFRGTDAVIPVTLAGVNATTWVLAAHFRHARSKVALVPVTTPTITVTYTAPNSVASIPLPDTATDTAAIGDYHWQLLRIDEGSEMVLSDGIMTLKETAR